MRALCLAAIVACATSFASARVAAAPGSPTSPNTSAAPPPADAPTSGTDSAAFNEAKERYVRALELVSEGAYDAALLEFKKAYALAPTYKLFYNMAVVSQRLNDFAEAYRLFTRYLSEGGAEVPAERRDFVQRQLKYLSGRVARIRIAVDVPGAEIAVDDAVVSPEMLSAPLLVNAGRRKISASAAGRLPVTRIVELAGGESKTVEFKLVAPPEAGRRPVERRPRREPEAGLPTWPFWAATAALGGVAGGYTIKAYASQKDLANERDTYGVNHDTLDDASKRARRDALIADVLWAGTAVAGGLAVLVTLTNSSGSKNKEKVQVGIGPTGARLEGRF